MSSLLLLKPKTGFPQRGLVGRWRLGNSPASDYVSSQIVADLSSKGNTLQVGSTSGVDAQDPTVSSNYVTLDGTDDQLRSSVNPTAAGTMISVFKRTDGLTARKHLMGSYDGASARCMFSIDTVLSGGIGTQNNTTIKGTTSLVNNTWYFGAITWNGSTVKLFLNGNQEYSAAQAGSATSGKAIWVGCFNNNGAVAETLQGLIASAGIFNVALTQAEIKQLYRYLKAYYAGNGSGISL